MHLLNNEVKVDLSLSPDDAHSNPNWGLSLPTISEHKFKYANDTYLPKQTFYEKCNILGNDYFMFCVFLTRTVLFFF